MHRGFEILSQFRSYFPQTQSLLMDRTTFDTYFEGDKGTPKQCIKASPSYLLRKPHCTIMSSFTTYASRAREDSAKMY